MSNPSVQKFHRRCRDHDVLSGALGQALAELDDAVQFWIIRQIKDYEISAAEFARALIIDAYYEDQV